MSGEMEEFKEAIIDFVKVSNATHPVNLIADLLLMLYMKGYSDGEHYMLSRPEEPEEETAE